MGTHAQIPCGATSHLVASYADKFFKTTSRSIQDVPMKQSQAQQGDYLDIFDALKVLHQVNWNQLDHEIPLMVACQGNFKLATPCRLMQQLSFIHINNMTLRLHHIMLMLTGTHLSHTRLHHLLIPLRLDANGLRERSNPKFKRKCGTTTF